MRGGPARGEEANGHTLLSLLLLVAIACMDADCDTKQPPPGEGGGGTHKKGKTSGEIDDEELICPSERRSRGPHNLSYHSSSSVSLSGFFQGSH